MQVTTVLLDAGGVILDEGEHESTHAHTAAEILSAVSPGYSVKDYFADAQEAVRSYCPRIYQAVYWKRTGGDRALYDRLYGRHLDLFKERRPPLRLQAGIGEELKSIARLFEIGLAGQYGVEILEVLESNGLADYFTYRFTQDDFDLTKPDPRFLEQIVRAMNLQPQACIMVGDRIDKDVIPARQVGLKTVLIRTGLHEDQQPRIPDEVPDIELPSVKGLAGAIERLAR